MERVICVGECMVELAPAADPAHSRIGFGGDTLNTAVYLKRLLRDRGQVSYMTRLGDDPYSGMMITAWRGEGIDLSLVETVPGRVAGLYAIAVDDAGERSFTYWRGQAPARELFTAGGVAARLESLAAARAIYLSGITLSILPDEGRRILLDALEEANRNGQTVIFDPNHRPRCWDSIEQARGWYQQAYQASTIALVGVDEEAEVFGDASAEAIIDRIAGCGCAEIVVKNGEGATLVRTQDIRTAIQPEKISGVVDTTAAGDSFNAGYIAGRLIGQSAEQSVRCGQQLAARVIQHAGAIIPGDQMPEISGLSGKG